MAGHVSAVSHSEQGFVMRQAEEARKQIQLWPTWHRRTLGEEQRIFTGTARYTEKHGAIYSKRVAVIAFTKEDAVLLIKQFCIASLSTGWNPLWRVENIRSQNLSRAALKRVENEKRFHVLNIPDEYYHVVLGQARWDEEKRNKKKV
ncbi:MAG: hypothetical protein HYT27_03125 [Parcubacteria group bacterium]|nr:hypothetical protein [Parcubacteria group bacterium]